MKKVILPVVLLLACAFIYWLGQSAPATLPVKPSKDELKKVQTAIENGVVNPFKAPATANAKDQTKIMEPLKGPEVDEQRLRAWDDAVKNFFAEKMKDDVHAFMDYKEMQAGYKEDRIDAYDTFMDEVRNEGREFNISELDEGEFMNIQKEYLTAFEKRFGREAFLLYLKMLEDFNDRMAKEAPGFQVSF